MVYKFKRKEKYEVLKLDDIEKYLRPEYKIQLQNIVHAMQEARVIDGKPACNTYIIVNEDEWYAETVWKLIEAGEILKSA